MEVIFGYLSSTPLNGYVSDDVVPFEGVKIFYQELLKNNVPTKLYTKNLKYHGFYVIEPSKEQPTTEFLLIIRQFMQQFI